MCTLLRVQTPKDEERSRRINLLLAIDIINLMRTKYQKIQHNEFVGLLQSVRMRINKTSKLGMCTNQDMVLPEKKWTVM